MYETMRSLDCPACGQELEFRVDAYWRPMDEIRCSCGKTFTVECEGGYGEDGTQAHWWLEEQKA